MELVVNGTSVVRQQVGPENILASPSRYVIDRALIRDGDNKIRIKKSGNGPIYFSVQVEFFSLEEPVPPSGHELFVRRQYLKIESQPTLLKGHVTRKVPLKDGDSLKSGDRVEVVITVEGKNNYEYLVFEDLKPAGLEAVQIRSGESLFAKQLKSSGADRAFKGEVKNPHSRDNLDYTNRQRWVYQELRDRKVALFIDKLPEGIWEMRYEMRAEVPGKFHALPVLGHAMYVPEIRCNSAEIRLTIID